MAVTLGSATAAWAQEPDTAPVTTTATATDVGTMDEGLRGLQLALSANLGLGAGYVYKDGVSRTTGEPEDLKVNDGAHASLPIIVEVGYRASPRCYLGLWGSYEYVFTKTNDISCPEGFDCSTKQWRFGPEVRYHFRPNSGFDPWVGLGVGLEILQSNVEGDSVVPVPGVGNVPARVEFSVTDRGPTFARLSLGGDVKLARSLALGPVLTASIGSYTVRTGEQTVAVQLPGVAPVTGPLTPVDDGFHALFTLGLRVAWLPL